MLKKGQDNYLDVDEDQIASPEGGAKEKERLRKNLTIFYLYNKIEAQQVNELTLSLGFLGGLKVCWGYFFS